MLPDPLIAVVCWRSELGSGVPQAVAELLGWALGWPGVWWFLASVAIPLVRFCVRHLAGVWGALASWWWLLVWDG
jgi:hypothetical protein